MRSRLLILASAVAMLGWGAVLPYQYAYAATTRGWGALVAAAASSLFSVGALIAAPVGGRLADRVSPVLVAVVAKLVAAAGALSLVWANGPVTFLAGMFVFGLGITGAGPAQSVLVLRWVGGADRRRVFAWQFTGQALGMAVGAFAAGYVVDLSRQDGMWPGFAAAAAGFLASGALLVVAGLRRWAEPLAQSESLGGSEDQTVLGDEEVSGSGGLRTASPRAALGSIWAVPALRWTALITVTLALGFYAQFESGLPAYALEILHVSASTIGLAAAVNCVVIIILQMLVVRLTARRGGASLLMVVAGIWTAAWLVRLTARRGGASLLMVVAGIWTVAWLVLATATLAPSLAGVLFVSSFGVFAVGETMYAPILNPLTASLAPSGLVGTTLGLFTALQTGFSAVGPLVAGVILGAGLGSVFVGLHIAISLLALLGAWRLRSVMRSARTARRSAVEAALAA